jgi:hypothetical protein
MQLVIDFGNEYLFSQSMAYILCNLNGSYAGIIFPYRTIWKSNVYHNVKFILKVVKLINSKTKRNNEDNGPGQMLIYVPALELLQR